jgi:hypothetical protein
MTTVSGVAFDCRRATARRMSSLLASSTTSTSKPLLRSAAVSARASLIGCASGALASG